MLTKIAVVPLSHQLYSESPPGTLMSLLPHRNRPRPNEQNGEQTRHYSVLFLSRR